MTPERFSQGRTFDEYMKYLGSPANLEREGFDVRRFSVVRPRVDWSRFFSERYDSARLSADQTAMAKWVGAQPNGPAKILVISEDWSSDCRRDVPYLARLAEAGGMELRIFDRDGDPILMKSLPEAAAGRDADRVREDADAKNGRQWASIPVAVFFTRDCSEVYRYVEFPAIYHKDQLLGHMRIPRPGETDEQAKARSIQDILDLLDSPIFAMWASSAVDEILSALHERLTTPPR